ncbi:protein of unknown function DUF151 [Desulfarculus baarsii DSM 2075]|uniref:BFN domain-containing protein n=1 Tax=Desulfarculus baarsii (strain ATCC 33931 / DSM 2075 / LMG 7858 / VKM B-1802 / 2st14) TaxID=644282 RepID=E1QKD0_DESB2|nr:bifunctional nuclease family protein [Desulfarculus baarsii]ADK86023.1 protein of unknown function DUF151 [Desulfarculus baarsii DSM 2075]
MIRMTVQGLTLDPGTNSPILILKSADGAQTLPIWIGLMEATAIASELEQIHFSRPMTHDLLKNLIDGLGHSVVKVEVVDLRDNTFYALIHLLGPGGEFSMDCRPSDAIALGLRAGAPIYVAEGVIAEAAPKTSAEMASTSDDKWKDILERMKPEDFGKYKM